MCIIGWADDFDDFNDTPSIKGAFITKNPQNRITYVSYDTYLVNANYYKATFLPGNTYDNIYYYDGGNTYGWEPERPQFNNLKILLTAKKEREVIKAINFNLNAAIKNITVNVYKIKDDINDKDETTNTLTKVVDGHTGINFVDFDKENELKQNDRFVVELNSNSNIPLLYDLSDDKFYSGVKSLTTIAKKSYGNDILINNVNFRIKAITQHQCIKK